MLQDVPSKELQTPIETVQPPNAEIGPLPSMKNLDNSFDDDNDDCDDDGDIWNEDELLDREGERRHKQLHTLKVLTKFWMGYRDGIIAGQQASSQEGFVIGFKQSVQIGYKWGHVRGVTSALALLPDHLKEKLIGKPEMRERLQNLCESVNSISTNDALKLFRGDTLANGLKHHYNDSERNVDVMTMLGNIFGYDRLGRFSEDLESLLFECPSIQVHAEVGRQMAE